MIDVRINNQSLRPVLAGPLKISDQVEAVCRVLELTVQAADSLDNYLGQPVEFFYHGSRWFFGFLFRRGFTADGKIAYKAYDPLIYTKKTPDDYYFKNSTATQGFKTLAADVGITVASLADTGAVFPALYYHGDEPDKIMIDLLARTYKENGRKFWYRFSPDENNFGLYLFERQVPDLIWAFQVGVNLTGASYEESIEETATVIKLINRETGKVVTRANTDAMEKYGHMIHFAEVDKDDAPKMEAAAQELLEKLAKVQTTASIDGVNPNAAIPQLYSGDVVYVEEKYTKLIGAYHIRNVTQDFVNDNLVTLSMDIQAAPDIPAVQYEDAAKAPKSEAGAAGTAGGQGPYNDEVKKLMEKYGI